MSLIHFIVLLVRLKVLLGTSANCTDDNINTITQTASIRPTESVFTTPLYGDDYESMYYLNQGRITTMDNWGIYRNNKIYNNTLYITNWDADQKDISDDGEMGYAGRYSNYNVLKCIQFTLNCSDYIVGYHIYDSTDFIHGISFYTSSGCKYDCVGNHAYTSKTVTDHGIISYYYGVSDFWYLSGFSGRDGLIMDGLRLQFTQFIPPLTCTPTQSPTFNPTSYPSFNPTNDATLNPTQHPIVGPSEETVEATETEAQPPRNSKSGGILSEDDMLVVVAGAVGFGICLIIVCGCVALYLICKRWVFHKETKEMDDDNDGEIMIQCTTQTSIQPDFQPGASGATSLTAEGAGSLPKSMTNSTQPGLHRNSSSQLFT